MSNGQGPGAALAAIGYRRVAYPSLGVGRVCVLGQRFVLERLLDLNGLAGVGEFVDIGGHSRSQITEGEARCHVRTHNVRPEVLLGEDPARRVPVALGECWLWWRSCRCAVP